MASHLYTISLLGVSLTVKTIEDLHYLEQLERTLTEAVYDVQENLGIQDPLSVAIMAGFFLSDQLHKIKDPKEFSENTELLVDSKLANILALLKDIV